MTIEHHHFQWVNPVNPLELAIFNSHFDRTRYKKHIPSCGAGLVAYHVVEGEETFPGPVHCSTAGAGALWEGLLALWGQKN